MPAPNPLTKIILRNARDAENASANTGLPLIKSYRSGLGNALVSAGRIMTSASGGGKAYGFANGAKFDDLVYAIDEAEALWIFYSTSQIAALLDTPPLRQTQKRFAC